LLGRQALYYLSHSTSLREALSSGINFCIWFKLEAKATFFLWLGVQFVHLHLLKGLSFSPCTAVSFAVRWPLVSFSGLFILCCSICLFI
jgi:hypothetical protein